MNESLRRNLSHVVFILGSALAVYLTALAFLGIPCPGDSTCLPILNSRFTVIFRLPASLYGALFWFGIMLVDERIKRGALLAIFATCSAVFLALQLYVLRGFCLYCVVHALFTFAAFWLRDTAPRRWWIPAALLLAGLGAGATLRWTPAEIIPTARAPELATRKAVQSWLGPVTAQSPVLVLKVDDANSLALLDALTSTDWTEPKQGPAIYFVITAENKTLTTIFVADVLAHADRGSKAFLDAARELCLRKETALKSPGTLAKEWTARQPAAREHRVGAAWILSDLSDQVRLLHLGKETPEVVTTDGERLHDFDPEILFRK